MEDTNLPRKRKRTFELRRRLQKRLRRYVNFLCIHDLPVVLQSSSMPKVTRKFAPSQVDEQTSKNLMAEMKNVLGVKMPTSLTTARSSMDMEMS
jgi:hypothetical protein